MFFYTVMKTPIVYLLFMIVLYLSCSPRPQSPADIHTDLSNNKILQLSELFDRIRYIPLETPDTALIANVQSVTYHNGRYYLIAENTLYVFNRHGQYLSQHNNRGRGANEYSSIFKVKSSIGDSVIYVSGDNGKGHIVMAYDKNGNYLKTLIQNRSFNMELTYWKMVSSFRMGEPSPYMTNKGNWKTKFGSVLSILSLSVRAIIYPISPARRLYSVVPVVTPSIFWVKAVLPVKYPWITVIIKARNNSKNRFRNRSPSLIFTISFP